MQKGCLNDLRRKLRTVVVSTIRDLDQVLRKSSMVLQMRQQGNLQDYPGGASVVRGLPMAAMRGWGTI